MDATSDSPGSPAGSSRPVDSIDPTETVELPPRVPELSTIKCPSCEATLQKVAITPGVKINCLHCGSRFFPPSANDVADATDAIPVGEAAKPKTREPKSPGYWLLRVPAVIVLVAGLFVTALIIWFGLHDFRMRLENFWAASYVPLIALAGTFAFLWSRALARIDAGMTHRFWTLGLLREPLPPMPGSSLPYIAPLAVVGGFFPVFVFSFGGESQPQEVFTAGLFGALLFLFGFMAEDIRQFAWREHAAAEKIAPPTPFDRHRPYGSAVYSWTGIACLGGFIGLAMLEAYIAYEQWSRGYSWARSEVIIFTLMSLAFIGFGVTGFKLCCDWDRAVASWSRVAARLHRGNAELSGAQLFPPAFQPRGFSAAVRWLPIAWALYGIVFLMIVAVDGIRDGGIRNAGIWLLIVVSSIFAAFWFSLMILQVSRWRQAKQASCALLMKEKTLAATPTTTGWPGSIFTFSIGIALLESVLMLCMLLETSSRASMEWQFFFATPLFLGIVHYPVFWIATMTREFVALEQDVLPGKSDE